VNRGFSGSSGLEVMAVMTKLVAGILAVALALSALAGCNGNRGDGRGQGQDAYPAYSDSDSAQTVVGTHQSWDPMSLPVATGLSATWSFQAGAH